jgi:hypothetical protein
MSIITISSVEFFLYYLLMVPIYMLLSPLCLVSSRLFNYFLRLIESDYTYVMLTILAIEIILSFTFLILVIRERTYRSLFYAEFILLIGIFLAYSVLSISALVGFTYSLFDRQDFF